MLSGRLCRACRQRLSGPHSLVRRPQQSAKQQGRNSQHMTYIGTSTGRINEAQQALTVASRPRSFHTTPCTELPTSQSEWPLADFDPFEAALGDTWMTDISEQWRDFEEDRLASIATVKGLKKKGKKVKTSTPSQGIEKPEAIDTPKTIEKPQTADNTSQRVDSSQTIAESRSGQRTKPQSQTSPRTKARAKIMTEGSVNPSQRVFALIRRRWKIPAERCPEEGGWKHHARTTAYLPILEQQYKQWGYLRHHISENELQDVRREFDRWYRRLGYVIVEPGRLNERTAWRDEASWLLEYPSAPAMCSAWAKLDVDERRRRWPGIMLSTMLISPGRAVDVLAATMSPLPPGYAIADVLQFIAMRLMQHRPPGHRERSAQADEIVHIMEEVLMHMPQGHVRPTQLTFGLFSKILPAGHTKKLYEMMKQTGVSIHPNTALHFASTLSRHWEHKQMALDILIECAKQGIDLNEAKFTSVITSLLQYQRQGSTDEKPVEDGPSFSKKALEELMEYGLIPNVINLTSFLDTLCCEGEVDEAIRLALLFSESGAKLDNRTFNTVFRAAKESRDPTLMRQALDVAKAAQVPIVDVYNNVLHSVFYVSEMERRTTLGSKVERPQIFTPLLRLYAERFSLTPLQQLIPTLIPLLLAKESIESTETIEDPECLTAFSVAQAFFKDTQARRLTPNSTTMSIMLRAYIRSLRRPDEVVSFYEYFKMKLETADALGVNQARGVVNKHQSLIHDTVILAMLDHGVSTRQLLQVLGDMLRDNLPASASSTPDSSAVEEVAKRVHPAPTLFTLSILISRLLLRRETMVARQLMEVMREHGITPNLETWNAMVKGYAILQDVPQTVSMLQKLEAAGYKPDNFTFRAFGKLKNQTEALNRMDQIIRQNEARLSRELI